jgi:hypothetical integral membrane protein (TIGR02206 family)
MLPAPATSSLAGTLAVAAVAASASLVARTWRADARRLLELSLAAANIVLLVASKAVEARHGLATLAWLPLHVCDVSSVAGALALLRSAPLWRATTLYFGVGLSTFAMLFPDVADGPASAVFWLFWLRHGTIFVTGSYDVIARGYRPTWRDYAHWCMFGTAYVALVSTVNALAHTNFAFIGDQTLQSSTILQSFGEWPARSVLMLALAVVHAAAITLLVQSLPSARRFDRASEARR